jgi:hypothetical protein
MVEDFLFNKIGLIANQADPCTYSGIYKGKPVILCRATNDFLLFCEDQAPYDAMMILDFRKKWRVHALDELKMFFGIQFICSPKCVTMDQTHKIKDLLIDVFGPSCNKQALSGRGYTMPFIEGTDHANELAACIAYSATELHCVQNGETFGFNFRHVLGGCMHCALWTQLDILTACLTLAQYQAAPGELHFRVLKHLVGYLRLHPDIPLTFNQASVSKTVQAMNFELLEPDPHAQISAVFMQFAQPTLFNASHDSDPDGFTSCDNLFQLMDTTTRQHKDAGDNVSLEKLID